MIEQLGNIGDFLGGIAVLVTLIYLAVQVRANTRSAEAQALSSWALLSTSVIDPMIRDDEFRILVEEVLAQDQPDFRNGTGVRVSLWLMQIFHNLEVLHRMTEAGTLDREFFETRTFYIRNVLSSPGGKYWWSTTARNAFTSAFVSLVEEHSKAGA